MSSAGSVERKYAPIAQGLEMTQVNQSKPLTVKVDASSLLAAGQPEEVTNGPLAPLSGSSSVLCARAAHTGRTRLAFLLVCAVGGVTSGGVSIVQFLRGTRMHEEATRINQWQMDPPAPPDGADHDPAFPRETGFSASSVFAYPGFPPESSAIWVPTTEGCEAYGLACSEQPESIADFLRFLTAQPRELPNCSNAFVLKGRQAYMDYAPKVMAHLTRGESIPSLYVTDGSLPENPWVYDFPGDVVRFDDGSIGLCRTGMQQRTRQALAEPSKEASETVRYNGDNGFAPFSLAILPFQLEALAIPLPNAFGQQELGILYPQIPVTLPQVAEWAHLVPLDQLRCANQFVVETREEFMSLIKNLAECERSNNTDCLTIHTENGDRWNPVQNQTYDASLERVIHSDGSQGVPCRTGIQEANLEQAQRFAEQRNESQAAYQRAYDERRANNAEYQRQSDERHAAANTATDNGYYAGATAAALAIAAAGAYAGGKGQVAPESESADAGHDVRMVAATTEA